MQGTVLVDKPFPDEPPLEQIHRDLLIGDHRDACGVIAPVLQPAQTFDDHIERLPATGSIQCI